MHTKQYILNDLRGEGEIPWDEAFKDFRLKPRGLDHKKVPMRDEVMRSLVKQAAQVPVEVALRQLDADKLPKEGVALRKLALTYITLTNKQARLPKFSKWVSSMFQNDVMMMQYLSKAGQMAGKQDESLIISCNPIDLLRGGDSPHFWSCLVCDGGYQEVMTALGSKWTGIAVAYVDAPDGKMKGRVWLHHAEIGGKTVIVGASHIFGNGFTHEQVGKLVNEAGYDYYQYASYWGGNGGKKVKVQKFIGCPTEYIHWDTETFNDAYATLISATNKEAPVLKKAA